MARKKRVYVQIGVTALREIDGSFLPSQPLYIKVPAESINPETGLYAGTEKMIQDASGIFTKAFKKYVAGGGLKKAEG